MRILRALGDITEQQVDAVAGESGKALAAMTT
jgi:hypothetical protein